MQLSEIWVFMFLAKGSLSCFLLRTRRCDKKSVDLAREEEGSGTLSYKK